MPPLIFNLHHLKAPPLFPIILDLFMYFMDGSVYLSFAPILRFFPVSPRYQVANNVEGLRRICNRILEFCGNHCQELTTVKKKLDNKELFLTPGNVVLRVGFQLGIQMSKLLNNPVRPISSTQVGMTRPLNECQTVLSFFGG